MYLQNLNTFHIWFLLHCKLRHFSVEALRVWQNGRLTINECRESNRLRWYIFVYNIISNTGWILNSFVVLNRFLCLKTLICDQLFTWDQQELQIYYYTWNNFSLYNTLKNSLNNLKIIILASVTVWFGADMCNVSFKNPFKNRLLFDSFFFFFPWQQLLSNVKAFKRTARGG